MLEELKNIKNKIDNKLYQSVNEYVNDIAKIDYDLSNYNTIEDLELVEQLLLQTKAKYNFDEAYKCYELTLIKINQIQNTIYQNNCKKIEDAIIAKKQKWIDDFKKLNMQAGQSIKTLRNNYKIKKLSNGYYNLYQGRNKILDNVRISTIYENI